VPDAEQSGTLDRDEMAELLKGMGVDPTAERLNEAFQLIDTDGSGSIGPEEFQKWWEHDVTTYELRRTEGFSGGQLQALKERGEEPPPQKATVRCFRGTWEGLGDCPSYDVLGLAPNVRYEFRLRRSSSISDSAFSAPIEVMTAPRQPTRAARVQCGAKWAKLQWYPGAGGAHRYLVQRKFVEALPGSSHAGRGRGGGGSKGAGGGSSSARRGGPGGSGSGAEASEWVTAYDGCDTHCVMTELLPNAMYFLRVQAANGKYGGSEWSMVTSLDTRERSEEEAMRLRPANAAREMTVECQDEGDVVLGDTVLFMERLYVDPEGQLLLDHKPKGGGGGTRGGGGGGGGGGGDFPDDRSDGGGGAQSSAMYRGQRTVVARVVGESTTGSKIREEQRLAEARARRESGLAPRRSSSSRGGGASARELRMEVVWSQVELKEAREFTLVKDAMIVRGVKQLFRYEVLRTPWLDDAGRSAKTWDTGQ
jgi:hypothetical protein